MTVKEFLCIKAGHHRINFHIFHSRVGSAKNQLAKICDKYQHAGGSAENCVHETQHCYNSYPVDAVTKLQGPTLILDLACCCLCLVPRKSAYFRLQY